MTVREILRSRALGTATALGFLLMLALGTVIPVMPLYTRSLGAGYREIGLVVGGYGLARVAVDLFSGILVHHVGERRSIVVGFALLAALVGAVAASPTPLTAGLSWALAGAVSALVFTGMWTVLFRAAPPGTLGRVVGVFYGAFNLGLAAGGFLGGSLGGAFGLRAPLVVAACILAVAAVVAVPLLPAVLPGTPPALPRGVASGLLRVLRAPTMPTALLTQLTSLWIWGAVLSTLLPLFAGDRLGMSTTGTGVAFAVAAAAELVILVPAGTAIDRRGRRAVLVPSLAIAAAATAVAGVAPTPVVLVIAIGVLGAASGGISVAPGAMVADAVDERDRPLALGWFRLSGDVGFAFGPLVVGFLIDTRGFAAAFTVAALPAVLTLALVSRLRR